MASVNNVIVVGRVTERMAAVSSALFAFIADLTSEEHRTKAMAMVAAASVCRSRWRLSVGRSRSSGSA